MTFFEKTMLVILVVMMVAAGSTMAAMYQVGDSTGWTVNHNYNEWVFFQQFKVDDTLVFTYNPQLHNVRQVGINDYNSCTDINPIASFNSGSDSITLDTPGGDYYFLCGIPLHCASGMKLHIKISEAISITPPTMANANAKNNPYQLIVIIFLVLQQTSQPIKTLKPNSSASSAHSFNMLFMLCLLAIV